MELTLSYERLSKVSQGLNQLQDKRLPFVLALKIGRITKIVNAEIEQYQSVVQKIFQEYGEKKTDERTQQTTIQVLPEHAGTVQDKISELNKSELTITIPDVLVADLAEQDKIETSDPTRALGISFYTLISEFLID
jgi:hypothetical protein